MTDLAPPRERTLATTALVLGVLLWLALMVGTMGFALIGVLVGGVVYPFVQSALVSHIRGNGVELSEAQFPSLHAQLMSCCELLKISTPPQVYIVSGSVWASTFAMRFLQAPYVVLRADLVDAMEPHADGVRFYLGHELGHLRSQHVLWHFLRLPALCLPLLGAAYARTRQTTSDRYGLACCATPEGAARALLVLAAGTQRWQQVDVAKYMRQAKYTAGFWMSVHELTAPTPWLTKRVVRVMNPAAKLPQHDTFAYAVAAFIPYAGRLGGCAGFFVVLCFLGLVASVAVPRYQDATARTKVSAAIFASQSARDALGGYYQTHKTAPESLDSLGIAPKIGNGASLSLDASTMVLTVSTRQGDLTFTPQITDKGGVDWRCAASHTMRPTWLPASCKP